MHEHFGDLVLYLELQDTRVCYSLEIIVCHSLTQRLSKQMMITLVHYSVDLVLAVGTLAVACDREVNRSQVNFSLVMHL